MERYTNKEIHERLVEKWYNGDRVDENGGIDNQVLFCAYYVPLKGSLGSDWGVIVNPNSPKFGDLVFEHDVCGCPNHSSEDPGPENDDQYIDRWLRFSEKPS